MLKKFLKFLKLANDSPISDNKKYITREEKKIYSLFNANFYEKSNIEKLESWLFYNYFDNSNNLTEKKYKLAVLSLVLAQKRVYLASMPLIDDIVQDISKELIDNKETVINLHEIFEVETDFGFFGMAYLMRQPRQIKGVELIPQLLSEDNHDVEKINISKKAYKKFSCLGLLAEAFTDMKSNIYLMMEFQDNKFNTEDINVLKKFIQKVTDPSYDKYYSVLLRLEYWDQLILNENSSDNLKIFKQIFENDKSEPSGYGGFFGGILNRHQKDTREDDKKYLIALVEKRIDYLELGNYLDEQPKVQLNKTRRPKL
jgi:hypothetical protein